jgi:hypothetical protein
MSLMIFVCESQADAQSVVLRYGADKVRDIGPQPTSPLTIFNGPDQTGEPVLEAYTDRWVVVIRP